MLNGSIGQCGTNGCHSTIGLTWQRFKTLQRSGCGLTTMTAQTWPWVDSHPSSGWPWLHNVSTSTTLAKGEDYQAMFRKTGIMSLHFDMAYCVQSLTIWLDLPRVQIKPAPTEVPWSCKCNGLLLLTPLPAKSVRVKANIRTSSLSLCDSVS